MMHSQCIQEGDKVKYIGCSVEQINWGNNDNPDKILKIGEKYIVEKTEVHTSHTKISIKGYNGKFNSVCFLKEGN